MKTHYRYLRLKNKKPYAIFCAIIPDNLNNKVKFGYTLCCKADTFTNKFARRVSSERAKKFTMKELMLKMPHSIRKSFLDFRDTTFKRYYDDMAESVERQRA